MEGRNKEKLIKMVNKVIREEARAEALDILLNCDEQSYADFINYYKKGENGWNICCLALDLGKKRLIEAGKMTKKEGDFFGNFL